LFKLKKENNMAKKKIIKTTLSLVFLLAAIFTLSSCSSTTAAPSAGKYALDGIGNMGALYFTSDSQYIEIKDASNLAYHDESGLGGTVINYPGTYTLANGKMSISMEILGTQTYDYKKNWDGSFSLTADNGSQFDFKKK
jgi:hypothetical protein